MDNRNTFFNRNQPIAPKIESVEVERELTEKAIEPIEKAIEPMPPPPIAAPVVATPAQPNWLSRIIGNANILQLVLLGVVFFMGNQFGSGCQKQKEIRQQITMIQMENKATLHKMDSLHVASAKQEAVALSEINAFYKTLDTLNLQSAVVKEQLKKVKTVIDNRQKEAVRITTEHNQATEQYVKESDNQNHYFELVNKDTLNF